MRCVGIIGAAFLVGACLPALAAEGPSIAGPIGGTDVRSAMLPPPGFYGGALVYGSEAFGFVDGHGNPNPALRDANLTRVTGGPFFVYVPDVRLFGGAVAIGGFFPAGHMCGRLFAVETRICQTGWGDPYIEATWSRSFGSVRPSRFPDSLPILEGLTVALSFGVIVPIGQFNATSALTGAISNGTHIWDFAPSVAVTYTTRPIFVEGTEFSAKVYWNNYLKNPATDYLTGTVINVDFAVSERMGRFQFGLTGIFVAQVEDDKFRGVPIPPDGRRAMMLGLGPVMVYDMPESGSAIKVKALRTVTAENTVVAHSLLFGVFKKFR